MKSLVELLQVLVLDCARKSGARMASVDIAVIAHRVEHEGDSFITITLPAFCRDFERSLEVGHVAPAAFASFGKLSSGIPNFLRGFLCKVFDAAGQLREDASVDCIRAVRQICLFGKKVQRDCSEERLAAATESFLVCDDEVGSISNPELGDIFRRVARIIIDGSPELRTGTFVHDCRPKHGSGATAEGIHGNQKWLFRVWHQRLEDAGFTWTSWGLGSFRTVTLGDVEIPLPIDCEVPSFVEFEDEQPVKVKFVPKTLKTPRVIAVEPVCMQYAQQALRGTLYRSLERNRFTAGHVNFRDQSVNATLAKTASLTGHLATLDMSEASDRVSIAQVSDLFELAPKLRQLLFACRSHRAQLPDGRIITLKKFASMGSAVCFPVEALVFFTSIIASRLSRAHVPVTTESVYKYGREVYVYGDDIIVPADEASAICDDLESLGHKVNRNKSFWNGKFRESCGMDAYNGQEVTPVYLRRDVPADRTDIPGLLSSVATANQLYSAGYYGAAAALREAVEKVWGKFPQTPEDSPAIGWNHHSEVEPLLRWNDGLQRRENRCWVAVPTRVDDPLDGVQALAKCFSRSREGLEDPATHRLLPKNWKFWEEVQPDEGHLEQSVRPYSLTLKRRWVPFG